ncbi:uncharacterized protein CTHT_0004350 [Thermochaetoides thermophila DSM 1495]|uniref:Uncharacterized protein n=1 Tax=Chaetomium thermophilum (strain DSM 1495 / CBS 144.50 / IMI 039719) TaxID=759272 RepID=G0RZV5_CHATD|nr:hypothetical protein CTHT_0004350 [Thermochaetoides thermophila DSM 1495]EGS23733.1 hypothetical protein CTHT_0004350 [Thermochaetoides thermophila DSM 1495]
MTETNEPVASNVMTGEPNFGSTMAPTMTLPEQPQLSLAPQQDTNPPLQQTQPAPERPSKKASGQSRQKKSGNASSSAAPGPQDDGMPSAFSKKRRGRPPGRPNTTVKESEYESDPLVQKWNAAKAERAVSVVTIGIREALTEQSLVHEIQRTIFKLPSRELIEKRKAKDQLPAPPQPDDNATNEAASRSAPREELVTQPQALHNQGLPNQPGHLMVQNGHLPAEGTSTSSTFSEADGSQLAGSANQTNHLTHSHFLHTNPDQDPTGAHEAGAVDGDTEFVDAQLAEQLLPEIGRHES